MTFCTAIFLKWSVAETWILADSCPWYRILTVFWTTIFIMNGQFQKLKYSHSLLHWGLYSIHIITKRRGISANGSFVDFVQGKLWFVQGKLWSVHCSAILLIFTNQKYCILLFLNLWTWKAGKFVFKFPELIYI